MADRSTRIHNRAESDYQKNDYRPPHSSTEMLTTFNRDDQQKIIDDNKAYDDGWTNARRQDYSGNWCFISAACARYAGLPDDCEELTAIRGFRDRVMNRSEAGRSSIVEYYRLAPRIVELIDRSDDRDDLYGHLLDKIREAAAAIRTGDHESASRIFAAEFGALKRRFTRDLLP